MSPWVTLISLPRVSMKSTSPRTFLITYISLSFHHMRRRRWRTWVLVLLPTTRQWTRTSLFWPFSAMRTPSAKDSVPRVCSMTLWTLLFPWKESIFIWRINSNSSVHWVRYKNKTKNWNMIRDKSHIWRILFITTIQLILKVTERTERDTLSWRRSFIIWLSFEFDSSCCSGTK